MKKRRKAAALKYETGYSAPVVTASGMGQIADKIIEKAEESNVPVVKDEALVDMLNNIDIGDSIPSELYEAVAKIIAFVSQVDKKKKRW
ncbi:MAG: EscU/YscU/HrcU family type III secretion system export apparatus switch protein [Bacillota bacterium]|nr:EscU/YscU/HrcU family type III secretion system export apparatus switch protein [Bacillota bacterium]